MKLLRSRFKVVLYSTGVFIFHLSYLIWTHRWEVDPHHDGIMFSAAVGASQGLIPNRDFFAQYGPITPIIQGVWFRITSPTVLNMKILTCLGLALISQLLFQQSRKVLGVASALLISTLYILTGPFGLPWSSIFSTLAIILSLIIIINSYSGESNKLWMLYLAGFILGFSIFIRIHVVAVGLSVLIVLALQKRISYLTKIFYRLYIWNFTCCNLPIHKWRS